MNDQIKLLVAGAVIAIVGAAAGATIYAFATKTQPVERKTATYTPPTKPPMTVPRPGNVPLTPGPYQPFISAAQPATPDTPEVRKARESYVEAQKRYMETMKKAMESQKAGGSIQSPAISGQPSAVSPPSGQPPRK